MRVVLVAEDPLARAGLAALLGGEPSLAIVGQVEPGEVSDTFVEIFRPDVVLWDLGWATDIEPDRLTAITDADLPLVLLAAGDMDAGLLPATGAQALINRDSPAETICAGLIAAHRGLIVLAQEAVSYLLQRSPSRSQAPVESLTAREMEVLQLLAEGAGNKEIARGLSISEHTVKFHVTSIMGKLDAQSRTEAVVRAARAGLIFL